MKTFPLTRLASLLFWTTCLPHLIFSQAPGGGNGNANTIAPSGTNNTNATVPAPSPSPRPPACNPVIEICPAGSFDCDTSAEVGMVVVHSPNDRNVYFQNEPLNISWTYSERTDTNNYPVQKLSIYITPDGQDRWTLFGEVPAKSQSFVSRNLMDFGIGRFQVRILPDNLERAPSAKIGNRSSCTPPGYPLGSTSRSFLVTTRIIYPDIPVFKEDPNDPNAPNGPTSDASSVSFGWFMSGLNAFGPFIGYALRFLVSLVVPGGIFMISGLF